MTPHDKVLMISFKIKYLTILPKEIKFRIHFMLPLKANEAYY